MKADIQCFKESNNERNQIEQISHTKENPLCNFPLFFFLNFSPHKNNFPRRKRHKIDYLADKQFVFKKKPLKIYPVSEITCNKTFPKGFSTTDTLLHN